MPLLGAEDAGSTGDIVLGLAIIAYSLATVVSIPICIAKGKWAAAAVGFFLSVLLLGIISIVAATRIAKPGSFWAKRFYDEDRMRIARERYDETPVVTSMPVEVDPVAEPGEAAEVDEAGERDAAWQCLICGEPYPTRDAALGHARSAHKGVNPETSIGQVQPF